jgi:hypothetical protein
VAVYPLLPRGALPIEKAKTNQIEKTKNGQKEAKLTYNKRQIFEAIHTRFV